MSEEQLKIELAEIEKDDNLTSTEKRIYLSIYGAELERVRSDKYISTQKSKIQNLRNILIEATRYGKSYGQMYERFDNKLQYIEHRKAEILNNKTI